MCGINGFTFSNRPLIQRMNDVIRHRGPDDEGIFFGDEVTLGNVRLAIVDISPKGHMPMFDMTRRYIITYNGEIYNFKELRAKLIRKGYKFKSQTDTEVIVNLFATYKDKAFAMLNGMFAIAIWDIKTQELVLARDRVGIKPLYYTVYRNRLIFSSEIKALLCHPIKKDINKEALSLYMRLLYVPAPFTMLNNIHKLEPGEYLRWKNGKPIKKFYWQLKISQSKFDTKQMAQEAIRTAMQNSVKKQLVADRPIGIFLSGGIDSTIITALAAKIHRGPLNTFSIGFSGVAEEEKFNHDFYLARKTAKYLGTNHHEFTLTPEQSLEYFLQLSNQLDEPIANPTHIPTFALAKETRRTGTVVALGGDGGDELFGGYYRYLQAAQLDLYQVLPSVIRHSIFDKLIYQLKHSSDETLLKNLRTKETTEKYIAFMGQNETEIAKIYSGTNDIHKVLTSLRGFTSDAKKFHQLLPWLDFLHWLPEESLMRSDKMTMLSSLEQRVPFLDNNVIDVASKTPFSWKVGLRYRKKILRNAFEDELPDWIVNAPKRGFFSPGAKWLRNKSWQKLLKDHLTASSINKAGLFNGKAVETMLKQHISGEKYNLQLLWSVLQFQLWYGSLYV